MPRETLEEYQARLGLLGESQARAMAEHSILNIPPTPNYSYAEQLASTYRQENLLAAGLRLVDERVFAPEPGFDPTPELGGYASFIEDFPELLEARSLAELAHHKNRIDRELQDRRTLAGAGLGRSLLLMPAVLFSPENAIPVGGALRALGLTGKTALAAAKVSRPALRAIAASTGRVGFEAAVSQALAESVLLEESGFRTNEEAAINIVGSGILGSLLGGAAGSLGVGRRKALQKLLGVETVTEAAQQIDDVGARLLDTSTPEGKQAEEIYGLYEDSPEDFTFGEEAPLRGLFLKAMEEKNPQLGKLLALDNKLGRFMLKTMIYQPASRLARSEVPESNLIGKVLTGHFVLKDLPEGAQGLSVEGATQVAVWGIMRHVKEQRLLYDSLREKLGDLSEERTFNLVGLAARGQDSTVRRPSNIRGRDVDFFAELNASQRQAIEELASVNRKFLDAMYRTSNSAGATTPAPKSRTSVKSVFGQLDKSYLSRAIDQDYAKAHMPALESQIRLGLLDRQKLAPDLEGELEVLRIQREAADSDADRAWLDDEIKDHEAGLRKLMDPAEFEDLAVSIAENYTSRPAGEAGAQRSTMPRVLDIDERYLEEFFRNDVRDLQQRAVRSLLPALSMADQWEFRSGSGVGMRQLARELGTIDDRVEKAREFGADRDSADEIVLEMGNVADRAHEKRIGEQLRLLKKPEKLTELREELGSAFAVRIRERTAREVMGGKLRNVRQDIGVMVDESRRLRSERQDLRAIEATDPDLALTEGEYLTELSDVSKRVIAANERLPLSEWMRDAMTREDLPEEEWHALLIGMGYTADEVATFQRFMELAPPQGEFASSSELYSTWRNRRSGTAPTGMIIGPTADRFRKTMEALAKTRNRKSWATSQLLERTETEFGVAGPTKGADDIFRVLYSRNDFLDSPIVRQDARIIDQAEREIALLERTKKKLEEEIDSDVDRSRSTVALPTADDLKSLRFQNEMLIKRISDISSRLVTARSERDAILQNIRSSLEFSRAASRPIERIARMVEQQVGASAKSMARENLVPPANNFTLGDAVTPEQIQRRLDALNRYLHAHVGEIRSEVYHLNVGTEHLARMIERGYLEKFPDATPKQLKARDREIMAMEAEVLRLLNREGLIDSEFAAWGKRVRDFNYMTKMGSVLLSSIPDLAMAISTAGMRSYMNALSKSLGTIVTGKIPKNAGAETIYAIERGLGMMRNEKLYDVADDFTARTKADQAFQWTREQFTRMTMIRRWNAFNKAVAWQAIESRMVKTILDGENATKQDLAVLQWFGIAERDLPDLKKILETSGTSEGALVGKFHSANTRTWRAENPAVAALGISKGRLRNLRLQFEGAIGKGVEDTIITPSVGDMPTVVAKHPMLRMLLQFRNYSLSVQQRVLIPGIQRTFGLGDPGPAASFAFSTAMGMLVYTLSSWMRGQDPFETQEDEKGDPRSTTARFVREGIDRGGTLGLLTEGASALERITGVGIGPVSRFASRNELDAWLGPSLGLAQDVTGVLGILGREDFTSADASRIRRLIVGQNLLILRALLDVGPNLPNAASRRYFDDFMKIEQRAAEAVGLDIR